MIRIVHTRAWQDQRATIGIWQIQDMPDSRPLFCLENPDRESDVDDVIDAGEYLCVPHNGPKYKGVWRLAHVPRRSDILIHWGNWEDDTLGCLLVGLECPGIMSGRPAVGRSKDAIDYLRDLIGPNEFVLEIKDGFK